MASTMRWLSASEIIASPAPRSATAAEGAATRARHGQDNGSARATAAAWIALRLLTAPPCDTADDNEDDDHQEQECQHIGQTGLIVGALLGARLPLFGIDGDRLDDVIHSAIDAAGEIVRPQAREDRVLDDEPRHRIGERALEAVADLDAYLALVRGDDQKGAGILLLLSDPPMSPELIAVILDRGALQRLESDDDKLPDGLGLELRELALERDLGRGIENSGIVDDAAGEL